MKTLHIFIRTNYCKYYNFDDGKKIDIDYHINKILESIENYQREDLVFFDDDKDLESNILKLNKDNNIIVWKLNLSKSSKAYNNGEEIFSILNNDLSNKVKELWFKSSDYYIPYHLNLNDIKSNKITKFKDLLNNLLTKKINTFLVKPFFYDNRNEIERFCNQVGYDLWAKIFIKVIDDLNEYNKSLEVEIQKIEEKPKEENKEEKPKNNVLKNVISSILGSN